MNDNDFYQFKKSLEKERDISFREAEWLELKERLDRKKTPLIRHLPQGLKWVIAIALPLVFFQFLFLHHLHKKQLLLQETLQQLETFRASSIRTEPKKTLSSSLMRDTVFIERIVYAPVPEPAQLSSLFGKVNNSMPASKLFTLPPASIFSFQNMPLNRKGLLAGKQPDENSYLTDRDPFTAETIKSQTILQPLPRQDRPDLSAATEMDPFAWLPIPMLSMAKSSFRKSIKKLLPRSFAVELAGFAGQSLLSYRDESILWGTNLDLNARFGNGWSIVGGLGNQFERFQLDVFLPDLGVPPVAPPAEGFIFEQAQVSQMAWQYHFGLRWQGISQSAWQPFLEIKYGQQFNLSSKTQYHFEKDNEEILLEGGEIVQNNIINRLEGGIGVWYHPARTPWQLGLSGHYLQSLPLPSEQLRQWSLKAGLQYAF